jgi:hypothetical protein
MVTCCKYNKNHKSSWNDFLVLSKNGTFMLDRNYMDYHSDQFIDHSLMFYDEDDSLVAVMPASLHGDELRSHGGLTYGGIISNRKMTVQKMLDVFCALKMHMQENNIAKLIYKKIPSIYYSYPSDEDLYALFRDDAELIRRDVSTAIDLRDPIGFSERRRRNIKKTEKTSLLVKMSNDFKTYVDLLNEVLEKRHNTVAAHAAHELERLAMLFPDNIKLFVAFLEDEMIAGSIVFETPTVAHTQYLANSKIGCKIGALDLVIDHIIKIYSNSKIYLDFGISTTKEGRCLNEGLISQKQEFGGRAIVHDFYELSV